MNRTEDESIDLYEPQEIIPVSKVKRYIINRPTARVDNPSGNFPDRIIEDKDVKLFRIGADFCQVGDDFQLLNNSPVEILDDSGQLIGYAHLELISRYLIASGSIQYSSPERLSIQAGEKLYLMPFCKIANGNSVKVEKLVLSRFASPKDGCDYEAYGINYEVSTLPHI